MPTPRTLEAFVQSAMEKSGMNQHELSTHLKLQRSAVGKWLTGVAQPSDASIYTMCRITGDDPERIIAMREARRLRATFSRKGYNAKLISSYLML